MLSSNLCSVITTILQFQVFHWTVKYNSVKYLLLTLLWHISRQIKALQKKPVLLILEKIFLLKNISRLPFHRSPVYVFPGKQILFVLRVCWDSCILWSTRSLFMTDYKFSMLKCDTETEELGNTSIIVFLTDLFQHVTAWSPGGSKTNGGVCIVSVCWGIIAECGGGGWEEAKNR